MKTRVLTPQEEAALGELDAYNAAYLAAQQEGGSREAILAILNATEPPELKAGRFHRMSFGLEYLLECTGNGRAWWARKLSGESAEEARENAAMVETLFIYADPAGAVAALGFDGSVTEFRKAAARHALGWTRERADAALTWAVQDMLRYWQMLPFLEAAAAAAVEPVPPQKADGSAPSLTGSAETTAAPSAVPSGGFVRRPPFTSGLPVSSAAAGNIPAPVLPTGPVPARRVPGGPPMPQGRRAVLAVPMGPPEPVQQ